MYANVHAFVFVCGVSVGLRVYVSVCVCVYFCVCMRDVPGQDPLQNGDTGARAVDLLEADDVGVLEFAQVLDVRLLLLPDLLDGHLLGVELPQENSALSPTAQPLKFRDLLKRDLPLVYR